MENIDLFMSHLIISQVFGSKQNACTKRFLRARASQEDESAYLSVSKTGPWRMLQAAFGG